MVSSSKKKRGKQRKAAKNASLDPNNLAMMYTRQGATFFHPSHHKLAALYVQKGESKATESMASLTDEDLPFHGIMQQQISLVQTGIVSTVLNFLGRCEYETFDGVLYDARGDLRTPNGSLVSNVGGDLVSPVVWISVLLKAIELEPGCRMQIAESIGPLVRCFVNDTERLFFNNNYHWLEGMVRFVELVARILNNDPGEKVVDVLLQHEGLLTSIVQWGYWGEQNRPDIAKELNSIPQINSMGTKTDITWIASLGRSLISLLVANAGILIDEGQRGFAKDRLETIGSTPIISKAYDASCMVTCVAGLVRVTKIKQDRESLITLLGLVENGCVDKSVIKEVIDFGLNHTTDTNTAEFVCLLSNMMILQYDNKHKPNGKISHPNDTRAAFAIRSGLIEMCLNFVDRFGKYESFNTGINGKVSLFKHILGIFNLVHKVSLHQKSAKAIRSKNSGIEDEVVHLEGNETIMSAKCKQILNMVWSTLSINGSYCCRCNRSLSRTDVMECNDCGHMTYCSKACQKEDWFNGHDMACKGECGEHMGHFQGGAWPITAPDNERAAQKMEELEKNMSMIQLKLFLVNSNTILSQAEALGIPLHDCIVHFDLRKCPIKVESFKYSNEGFYGSSRECLNDFETSRSKDNITCLYTSSFYDNGELLEDGRVPYVTMQRMFPHEWLINPFGQLLNDEEAGTFEFE